MLRIALCVTVALFSASCGSADSSENPKTVEDCKTALSSEEKKLIGGLIEFEDGTILRISEPRFDERLDPECVRKVEVREAGLLPSMTPNSFLPDTPPGRISLKQAVGLKREGGDIVAGRVTAIVPMGTPSWKAMSERVYRFARNDYAPLGRPAHQAESIKRVQACLARTDCAGSLILSKRSWSGPYEPLYLVVDRTSGESSFLGPVDTLSIGDLRAEIANPNRVAKYPIRIIHPDDREFGPLWQRLVDRDGIGA